MRVQRGYGKESEGEGETHAFPEVAHVVFVVAGHEGKGVHEAYLSI